jgi:hypothetical protein
MMVHPLAQLMALMWKSGIKTTSEVPQAKSLIRFKHDKLDLNADGKATKL